MVDGMNPETRSQCLFVDGRMWCRAHADSCS